MGKYDINYKKLALLLLPTFLRKPIVAGLLYAGTSALNRLHLVFSEFRKDVDYRVNYNGQVCYLRAVLNECFDPIDRRITVTENAEEPESMWLYMRQTEERKLISPREDQEPLMITRRGFAGAGSYDFWINLPFEIYAEVDLERVKAITNMYKLASKRYGINFR